MTSLPSVAFNSLMCLYVEVGEIQSSHHLYLDLMYDLQSVLVIVQVDVCEFIETAEDDVRGILWVRSDHPQTQFCAAFLPLILRVCSTMLRNGAYFQPTCQPFVHGALQDLQLQHSVLTLDRAVHQDNP